MVGMRTASAPTCYAACGWLRRRRRASSWTLRTSHAGGMVQLQYAEIALSGGPRGVSGLRLDHRRSVVAAPFARADGDLSSEGS